MVFAFELIFFFCIAAFTLATAAAALFLRSILHGALLLTASWVGVAAFYLWAGAEFAAFAQTLVYVGAVSMVALFAVALTRREGTSETGVDAAKNRRRKLLRALPVVTAAALVALAPIAAVIMHAKENKSLLGENAAAMPTLTVKEIGAHLMGGYAGALLVVGVLLTVALLGAVVIAAPEE
jgi:NADH:ubiquinone oxidoreductase subunit 6 (subunit J)